MARICGNPIDILRPEDNNKEDRSSFCRGSRLVKKWGGSRTGYISEATKYEKAWHSSCFTNSSGGFIRTPSPIWNWPFLLEVQVLYEYHWISQHCNFCNTGCFLIVITKCPLHLQMFEGRWVPIGFSKKKVVPKPWFPFKGSSMWESQTLKTLAVDVIHSLNTSVTHGTNEWPEVNLTPWHPACRGGTAGRKKAERIWSQNFCWLCELLHPSLLSTAIWLSVKKVKQMFCSWELSNVPCKHDNLKIKKKKKNNGVALVLLVRGFCNPCFVNQSILL